MTGQHFSQRRSFVGSARKQLFSASAVISDIDGVLLLNERVMHGTAALAACKPLALVSNNSTHTAEELCRMFRDAGVPLKPEQFFLAGEAAVRRLAADLPGARILTLGTPAIQSLLLEYGLFPISHACWRTADAVLICRDIHLTYERLEAAVNAALAGIPVYCSNPDFSHPAQDGVHLETGSILSALVAAAPHSKPIMLGKPLPDLLLSAIEFLREEPKNTVFLGDNVQTDALCAEATGVPFLYVNALKGPTLAHIFNL